MRRSRGEPGREAEGEEEEEAAAPPPVGGGGSSGAAEEEEEEGVYSTEAKRSQQGSTAPAPAPATTGEGGGKVWWPWTAWDSVLQRVRKGMIADEAERRKKSQLKEENKED